MEIIKISSKNHNGFISSECYTSNSLTFNIDLPKSAAVDYIRLEGEFEYNGIKYKDVILNDIEAPVVIVSHRELAYKSYNPLRMQRVAATAYFPEGVPADLLQKVQNYVISHFWVYYHNETLNDSEFEPVTE